MLIERKGRCPLCNNSMKRTKTVYWKGKCLSFKRLKVYHCQHHGAFIWQRRKQQHQLADFSRLKADCTVETAPPQARWVDYEIIEMECSPCGEKWKQHKGFPAEQWGYILCPGGHRIPRNEVAIVEKVGGR